MGPVQILGGVLVIASIILLQRKQDMDENAPEVIRAQRGGNSRGRLVH